MKQSSLTLPISIVVAGLIIGVLSAGAIMYTQRAPGEDGEMPPSEGARGVAVEELSYAPVSADDHIRGSIEAPVKLVTYSDFDCSFCKVHHPTLIALYEAHGGASFAWVYRHFPLQRAGESSVLQAVASECVALRAGNEGFWRFVDKLKLHDPANPNRRIDLALLPRLATEAGVTDIAAYERCYANNETLAKVEAQREDGMNAGATGTPYGLFVSRKPIGEETRNAIIAEFEKIGATHLLTFAQDESAVGIGGAIPLENMQAVLETLIRHNS